MYVCSSICLHRMSPNTACNCLLHINLSIVQLLCLYMHLYLFVPISCSDVLSVFSFFIYLSIYLSIRSYVYFIYAYVCIYVLYLSGTFLAHVLRPNSFHRCSNFTSHCRNVTSLPQKRFRGHARAFYFPASFQVQLTYFHTHVTFSFRSPPPEPQVLRFVSKHFQCGLPNCATKNP